MAGFEIDFSRVKSGQKRSSCNSFKKTNAIRKIALEASRLTDREQSKGFKYRVNALFLLPVNLIYVNRKERKRKSKMNFSIFEGKVVKKVKLETDSYRSKIHSSSTKETFKNVVFCRVCTRLS